MLYQFINAVRKLHIFKGMNLQLKSLFEFRIWQNLVPNEYNWNVLKIANFVINLAKKKHINNPLHIHNIASYIIIDPHNFFYPTSPSLTGNSLIIYENILLFTIIVHSFLVTNKKVKVIIFIILKYAHL